MQTYLHIRVYNYIYVCAHMKVEMLGKMVKNKMKKTVSKYL